MERLDILNKYLTNGLLSNDEKSAILLERKEIINKTFDYLPEQLEILRRTDKHLVILATKIYYQVHKLENYLPEIIQENKLDGFSCPYITGEVFTTGSIKERQTNDLLPGSEISSKFFQWEKNDSSRFTALKDYLYRPIPKEIMEKSEINWWHLKDLEPLCYGTLELLFKTDFSLQDLMERITFGCKVELHTSKVIMIENIM